MYARSIRFMGAVVVVVVLGGACVRGEDWPQWGRDNSRNMASPEKGLPDSIEVKIAQGVVDVSGSRGLKWAARLGSQTYGNPTVAGGRIFVGTNADVPDPPAGVKGGGAVLCFEAASGGLLWRLCIPRFVTRDRLFNFDQLNAGVCSSPTVDGDRVYVVPNRGEVLCLDVKGQADGNDGPFREEARFVGRDGKAGSIGPRDGDILWTFDMLREPTVACWPQDAVDSSVLVRGDLVYVCTSNGVDKSHKTIQRPNAPSIIALDKRTGKFVAGDDARIGPRILHGEWASPALANIGGRDLIIHGGGDGACYAFEPQPSPAADGKGRQLKTVWRFDCVPADMRVKDGSPVAYKMRAGPSEIIATPVVWRDRVYVAIGQDPRHGKGAGNLVCIDATGRGDVTGTHGVWNYRGIDRTLSTVSIVDGLLFVADYSGIVHCLDAQTGKVHWTYDVGSPLWSSTLAADGKLYLTTERGHLLVLAASRDRKLIHKSALGNKSYATPVAANGVLYLTTQTHLFAATR